MKKKAIKLVQGVAFGAILLLSSCHSAYEVTKVEGRMQPIDSTWDANPDADAVALLAPYKAKIDSIMNNVVGPAEM